MRSIVSIFAVAAIACGGNTDPPASSATPSSSAPADLAKPAPADPKPSSAYGGASYGGARFDTTQQLKTFHDLIAPLAGRATAQRRKAACAAAPRLLAAAKALSRSPPPAGADPIYEGEADELEAITDDLGPNCAEGDPATIDFDIDHLHRSYQRLLTYLPTYRAPAGKPASSARAP